MNEHEAVKALPVLPLKNTVLFPQLLMPLSVLSVTAGASFLAGTLLNERKLTRC